MVRKAPEVKAPVVAVIACKFAGDVTDEFCKTCSGVTMIDESGKEVACELCGGYQAGTAVNQPAPQPVDPEPAKVVEPAVVAPPVTPPAEELSAKRATTVEEEKAIAQVSLQVAEECSAVTTEIRAESGISFEAPGNDGKTVWYKYSYAETRKVGPYCDLEEERAKLWEDVNRIVDDQVAATPV